MHMPSARVVLAVAVATAAGVAYAQPNPLVRPAQAQQAPSFEVEGFFRPTPDGDPSLTKQRPPAPPQQAAPQPDPRPSAMQTIATRGPDSNPASAPAAIEQARWTEEQLDRTERESERDRVRALSTPPPVAPGAYDGKTSERDR